MRDHVHPRPLLLSALLVLVASLALNAVSQALPRVFTAHNIPVAPLSTSSSGTAAATAAAASDPLAIAYITAHPATHIGFWKQCNNGHCSKLVLPCGGPTTVGGAPIDASKVTDPVQKDFVDSEHHLCPRFDASRILLLVSLATGLVSLLAIGYKAFGKGSPTQRLPLVVATLASIVTALLNLVSLILLALVKRTLMHLAVLARTLSRTGTSTPLTDVTTVYETDASVWILVAGTALAVMLLPLIVVLAVHPAAHRDVVYEDSQGLRHGSSSSLNRPVDYPPAPEPPAFPEMAAGRQAARGGSTYSSLTTVSAPRTDIASPDWRSSRGYPQP
ncbi:hypothetical protein HKX48_007353 [Thoreauomyces humboldtii]|nr:hypothetical protein HKX48_007353 [Thoreauomyces humboldtii]